MQVLRTYAPTYVCERKPEKLVASSVTYPPQMWHLYFSWLYYFFFLSERPTSRGIREKKLSHPGFFCTTEKGFLLPVKKEEIIRWRLWIKKGSGGDNLFFCVCGKVVTLSATWSMQRRFFNDLLVFGAFLKGPSAYVGVGLGGRGGNGGSQPGGRATFDPAGGGQKKFSGGGIEGGTRTKFSSNFIKQQKNWVLHLQGGTVLQGDAEVVSLTFWPLPSSILDPALNFLLEHKLTCFD